MFRLIECPVKLPANLFFFIYFIFIKPGLNALSSVRKVTFLLNRFDVFTVNVTCCTEVSVQSVGLMKTK